MVTYTKPQQRKKDSIIIYFNRYRRSNCSQHCHKTIHLGNSNPCLEPYSAGVVFFYGQKRFVSSTEINRAIFYCFR